MSVASTYLNQVIPSPAFEISYPGEKSGTINLGFGHHVTLRPQKRRTDFPSFNKIELLGRDCDGTGILILDHDTLGFAPPSENTFSDVTITATENLKDHIVPFLGDDLYRHLSEELEFQIDRLTYFNCGVVFCPAKLRDAYFESLNETASRICLRLNPKTYLGKFPFGNFVFSVAAARRRIPVSSAPSSLNQRDWGEITEMPTFLHYNDISTNNTKLKYENFQEIETACEFIFGCEGPFWEKMRSVLRKEVVDMARAISCDIISFMQCDPHFNDKFVYE